MTSEDKTKLQDMLQNTYQLLENLGTIINSTSSLMKSNKDVHETNKKYLDEISAGINLLDDTEGKLAGILSSTSDKVIENPTFAKASLAIANNIIQVEQDIIKKIKINTEAAQNMSSIGIESSQYSNSYNMLDEQITQVCNAILDVLKRLND